MRGDYIVHVDQISRNKGGFGSENGRFEDESEDAYSDRYKGCVKLAYLGQSSSSESEQVSQFSLFNK